MLLRVIRKLSLSDQVFEQLSREIVSGRCKPDTQLPPERTLVETFRVNRHVVREALKRLEQIGLVNISQGGGTTVLDFRRHAGLDLLALMAEYAEADEKSLKNWLAIHEMRAVIAADSARLCALRADQALKQKIVEQAGKMAEVADGPELFTLELRFWELVIEGAQNIAYQLAFNSLVKAVLASAVMDLATQWSIHEIKQGGYRVPIAMAIALGDARTAEQKTREAMSMVFEVLNQRTLEAGRAARTLSSVKREPVRAAGLAARKRRAISAKARRA